MKILVTGAAGYIGSHVVISLIKAGHQIFAVDNFCNSNKNVIKRLKKITRQDFFFKKLDIRDFIELDNVFKEFKPEAVVHLAGIKSVFDSCSNPTYYYDVNCNGAIQLLYSMEKSGCKKIIFSSSATVYGHPKKLPFDENHETRPTNPYGRSKLHIEEMLGDWSNSCNKNISISLRYFNPVGADKSGEIGENPIDIPANLFPFIQDVASGKRDSLFIYGDNYDTKDGTGVRDYIHVSDLADAHRICVECDFEGGKNNIINLGTGRGYTVFEVVEAFNKITGREIPYKIVDRRDGDVAIAYADNTKSLRVLKWKPANTLENMVEDAWNWHLKNPDGYN